MCTDCNDVDINTSDPGNNGWSPILALVEGTCGENPVTVHQLVGWTGGTGTKPSYDGNILTDAYLLANPIYLGEDGFVTDICNATDLKPTNGEIGPTGPTGATGATGEQGTPGCDPTITITAQVSGSEPYEVTVTREDDPLTNCAPEYNFEFPIEMITENTEITDAIDEAVEEALEVTPTSNGSLTISTGNSTNLKYTVLAGTPTVSINNTFDNWITYYELGNQMTINFRIHIGANDGGLIRLEMLIPNNKTSTGNDFSNSISVSAAATTIIYDFLTPTISTNSNTGNTHLKLSLYLEPFGDLPPIPVGPDAYLFTFMGQITFLTN